VEYAQKNLGGAQYSYEHTYIKNNFTVMAHVDTYTGRMKKYVQEPSEAEIMTARADVAEAEAALEEAGYYYAALTGGEVPSDATGDSLTALEDANANVKTAQSALDGTQIVATIDGTVMSVETSVGDTVKSGTAVITVADLSIPYLECYLDESDWQNVKTDADVEVTFDILEGQTFSGQVTQVDPGLYTQSNSSVVRAYVEIVGDEAKTLNLPLGTTAAVEIIGARADNALLIPLEALHKTDSGTYAVFVVESGIPTLRIVEIGIQDLLYAEVKSGLSAGDIVTTGIMETQ
jgi:RND family efflux transporter MFP subunit